MTSLQPANTCAAWIIGVWLGLLGVGSPYAFAQTPQEEALLRASNAGEEDLFGYSVSIDGDRAIVGALDRKGVG